MTKPSQFNWKLPAYEAHCPSPMDWAQMAAYIDGEGSILINTQKNKRGETRGFYLRVTIANTDIRLMSWLKETFGGTYKAANTAKYYEGKNWKHSYHWGCSSHRAAWILHNCLLYFHMKQDQAELGLQLQVSLTAHSLRGRSKNLKPEVHEERRSIKERLLVLKAKGINGIPVPSGPVSNVA